MELKLEELERALETAEKRAGRLSALLNLVEFLTEDFVTSWSYANEALDLAQQLDDRASIARAHEGVANTLWKLSEYSQSMEHFELALDKYLSLGNLHKVAKCYCGLGIICGITEEYRTALEYFEEGLSASRRAERYQLASTITGNIGHVYFNLGRYNEAMECFKHSYDYCVEMDIKLQGANMLMGMAGVHVYKGEHSKGLEFARRAHELSKKCKDSIGLAIAKMNIGIALHKMGELDKAKKELIYALNYARSIRLKNTEYDILKNLSQLCSDLGQEEDASKYLNLYMEEEKEAKKLLVQKKTEQFRQRQQIKQFQQAK